MTLSSFIMFKDPFSFDGRIRRTEYGISLIIYFAAIIFIVAGSPSKSSSQAIMLLLFIPILWFRLAQAAKRCHDLGNSGWYQIIPFYFFWLLFADGNAWPNEYGSSPKYEDHPEDSYKAPFDDQQYNA